MDDEQSSSVRNLPPGRLSDIRQQFEQNVSQSPSKPPVPTKASKPVKIPRRDAVKSPSSMDAGEISSEKHVTGGSRPDTPKSMDIPPIPPKENSISSMIQCFSPPTSNIPQLIKGTTVSSKTPSRNSASPKQEANGRIVSSHSAPDQSNNDISKLYSTVNKDRKTSQHTHNIDSPPKKDKPPLKDKPKITKKPVLPDVCENSPKPHPKTHERQSSVSSTSSKVLQTSKSLSGDWLCLVEDQYTGVSSKVPPKPPVKPPRTHAHDKYLDAKPFHQKLPISPKRSSTLNRKNKNNKNDTPEILGVTERKEKPRSPKTTLSDNLDTEINRRPEKPKRPPPPRPKSSPSFSSVKSFSFHEDESGSPQSGRKPSRMKSPIFDNLGNVQHPDLVRDTVFESRRGPSPKPVLKPSPIMIRAPPGVHHNALHHKREIIAPRSVAPLSNDGGFWRSCSDECIYKDPSLSGDPVYMDPMEVCRVTALDDTYASHDVEVYIDAEGYAVPHKFNKQRGPNSPGPGVKDRVHGLFRMFSVPSQPPDTPRVQKKRLAAVKQKINQAFSLLQKIVKKRESVGDQSRDSDRTSLDSDSFVDVTETMRRVEYVNSVKVKTKASVRNVRLYLDKIYPQLYECAIIVGLEKKLSDGQLKNEAFIKHKFPEMVNIAETIPQFCFPDAQHINLRLVKGIKSETYSFVLTNADGNHVFGYCRRYTVVDDSVRKLEVICILSPVGAFQMYNQLLDEIEHRRRVSFDMAQELIASSFGRPLPSPGKTVNIRTMTQEGEVESVVLSRAFDNRVENINSDCLLTVLGVDKLVKVFASLLLERKLLFFASSLSVLSSTIHALVSLLYPFLWHHTYIPVLPPNLLDIVCAPTPFIIGALSSEMSRIDNLPMEEALVIDLDSKCFVKGFGDESTILPKKLQKALKTALNLCRMESDKQSQNMMITEAFIRLFVEMIGHYGEFILTQPDGSKVFQKEAFISGVRSEGIGQLLQWFTETQMFEVFITDQIVKDHHKTTELFNSRIMEYKESGHVLPSIKSNVREIGRKMKNIGKAIKTKLT